MYQGSSPYAPPMSMSAYTPSQQGAYVTPVNGAVQPGDISYGQIVGPDSRIVYQLFRAVPASYPTPNGVISGVQWMPAEAVASLPPGAIPANVEFVNNWIRSNPVAVNQAIAQVKEDRYKEKESKRHSRNPLEYESLQKARDRDQAHDPRRSSFHQSEAVPFPGTNTGYPTAPQGLYGSPYAVYGDPSLGQGFAPYGVPTAAYPDIAQQLSSMELNRNKDSAKERERKNSEHGKRSRRQSTHEPSRPQVTNDPYALPPLNYGNFGNAAPAAYGTPYPVAASSHSSNASPNTHARDVSYGSNQIPPYGVPYASSSSSSRKRANSNVNRSTTPAGYPQAAGGTDVYPPGHILEGQSKQNNLHPKSRATTPNPQPAPGYPAQQPTARPASRIGGRSPHPPAANLPAHQLAAPDAFSRPINAALPYAPFKPIKAQDMDEFFTSMPKLPPPLETHDVRNEDWFRFMEDVTLAWTGRLPATRPDGKPTHPATVTADLFHTWNTAFFEPRGIEVVLYRGYQRRSGKLFGRSDLNPADDSESSSSSSTDSDSDGPYPPPPARQSGYNRPAPGSQEELAAARRRYYEEKQADIRRRRERRKRNKEKRRNKKYTVYATYIRDGGPMSRSVSAMGAPVGGMPPVQSSYPGMYQGPGSMGPPPGPPPGKSRSHGRGPSTGGKY